VPVAQPAAFGERQFRQPAQPLDEGRMRFAHVPEQLARGRLVAVV